MVAFRKKLSYFSSGKQRWISTILANWNRKMFKNQTQNSVYSQCCRCVYGFFFCLVHMMCKYKTHLAFRSGEIRQQIDWIFTWRTETESPLCSHAQYIPAFQGTYHGINQTRISFINKGRTKTLNLFFIPSKWFSIDSVIKHYTRTAKATQSISSWISSLPIASYESL